VEKLVYLLWGDPEGGDRIRDFLLGETAPVLERLGGRGITVSVHDAEAARAPSPVPVPAGEDPHVAAVGVWLDSYDRRAGADEAVAALGLEFAGYLVTGEPVGVAAGVEELTGFR
jgi:hypothetical protein